VTGVSLGFVRLMDQSAERKVITPRCRRRRYRIFSTVVPRQAQIPSQGAPKRGPAPPRSACPPDIVDLAAGPTVIPAEEALKVSWTAFERSTFSKFTIDGGLAMIVGIRHDAQSRK